MRKRLGILANNPSLKHARNEDRFTRTQRTMKKSLVRNLIVCLAAVLAAGPSGSVAEEKCDAQPEWVHATKAPDLSVTPLNHKDGGDDCPFYQAAWQTFLYVTRPDYGVPVFLNNFATIESTFGSQSKVAFPPRKPGKLALLPLPAKTPHKLTAGIEEATRLGGTGGVLIDRDGFPVYFAIHMNDVFTNFLEKNNLKTAIGVQKARTDIFFPPGTIELKSAWKVVPPGSSLDDKYFTVDAQVPKLKKDGASKNVIVDAAAPPLDVKVALVAIHVVFVLGDHSEFIWSTFEHVDDKGDQTMRLPGLRLARVLILISQFSTRIASSLRQTPPLPAEISNLLRIRGLPPSMKTLLRNASWALLPVPSHPPFTEFFPFRK